MSEMVASPESLLQGLAGLELKRLRNAAVVIAGAGNIGSHLAPLLARAGVRLIRIIDRDRVEAKNLANQDFRREHVGGWKAEVLAERIQGQFPGLTVEARPLDLEDLPLGGIERSSGLKADWATVLSSGFLDPAFFSPNSSLRHPL